MRRRIGIEERRARLGRRHRLAAGAAAESVVEVADELVALHGTDPASVYLAVLARTRDADIAAVERAFYEDRALVRMLGMRRTMFAVSTDVAPVVEAACTRAVAARERRKLEEVVVRNGLADEPAAWLAEVEEEALRALHAREEATAAELAADVPGLAQRVVTGSGKWTGEQALGSRVLFLLAADGRIVRGRPRGTWTSSQYRWTLAGAWLPAAATAWSTEDAQVELARRWLAAFGPATAADLKWWAGWTLGEARRALARLRAVEVDLDGEVGLVLPGDVDPVSDPGPWVALLPALDPTAMGWADRDWYLGEHRAALFDRSGNVGPTVWSDGRIVGGWAQRAGGDVAVRLLEDPGAEARAAIDAAAERLPARLGDVVVTPRFRTPLERELSA